jgi:hypothetical protein
MTSTAVAQKKKARIKVKGNNFIQKGFLMTGAIMLLLLASCSKKKVSTEEYLKYINQPENGLITTKKVNGFVLSLKYLPPEYLTAKELADLTTKKNQVVKDSLLKYNRQYKTFLLTFSPDEEKGNHNDVMLDGVKNYEEFSQKVEQMNFGMGEYIHLKTDKGTYAPVLTNLENTYGLSKARSLTLVFTPQKNAEEFKGLKEWDIVYEDDLFGAGILHFVITQADIEKLPELVF